MSTRPVSPARHRATTSDDPTSPLDVVAAGGVVWRGDPAFPEVALVHRPAYDDWSFPKGKQDDGEHLLLTAVREIAEELGARVELGVPLPAARYTVGGSSKTVHYWVARHLEGDFAPSEEVDEAVWLAPEQARAHLTHGADRRLLDAFTRAERTSRPSIAVRHAKAKPRSTWTDDDEARPLTGRGQAQAQALAEVLSSAYGALRIVSSPWLRCVQTVEPYARAILGTVELLDSLGEEEYAHDVASARTDIRRLAQGEAVLACSHGNVMPDLVAGFMGPSGQDPGLEDGALAKGEFVVAHRVGGLTVAVERHRV